MATDVIMPSLGFDMTEGKLSRWLKKVGEPIEKGQPIAEIETEKATVEIEAGVGGILAKILVEEGRTVPIGTVIGVIAEPGEKVEPGPPPAAATSPPPGTKGATGEAAAGETAAGESAPREGTPREAGGPAERVKSSPVARRMAEKAGIDISTIRGTGPDGRIMERDVEAAIASRSVPGAAPGAAGAPPAGTKPAVPAPAPGGAEGGTVPLTPMRMAIARRMAQSKAAAPHFYVTVEIHMDEALKVREELNAVAAEGEKVSVNDMVVAAAAKTLSRFRDLNASYRDGGLEVHPGINIGIAVAVEEGLITPVLRGADAKPLKAIAAEAKALSERARSGRLRADDLGPGTFTVSNLGMFEVDQFVAIINPPEAAILAVGAVTPRPVAAAGEIRIASTMKATLSVDHRVADGAQAARFMQAFKKLLENPVNLLVP